MKWDDEISCPCPFFRACMLIPQLFLADFDQAQMMMLAGFVMLGWILARRTINRRKTLFRENRQAEHATKRLQSTKEHAVPLSDAPVEAQRWQVAMFDLQRELQAELDTRIAVVQTLLRQADQRIHQLQQLQSASQSRASDKGATDAHEPTASEAGEMPEHSLDESPRSSQSGQQHSR